MPSAQLTTVCIPKRLQPLREGTKYLIGSFEKRLPYGPKVPNGLGGNLSKRPSLGIQGSAARHARKGYNLGGAQVASS